MLFNHPCWRLLPRVRFPCWDRQGTGLQIRRRWRWDRTAPAAVRRRRRRSIALPTASRSPVLLEPSAVPAVIVPVTDVALRVAVPSAGTFPVLVRITIAIAVDPLILTNVTAERLTSVVGAETMTGVAVDAKVL